MPEVGDKSVGYIGHRMRDAGQSQPQFDTWFRQLKVSDQVDALFGRERRVTAAQNRKAEKGVADRVRDPDLVSRTGAAAADLGAGIDFADYGQRQHRRSVGRDRVAAEKIDPVVSLVLGAAYGESREPMVS